MNALLSLRASYGLTPAEAMLCTHLALSESRRGLIAAASSRELAAATGFARRTIQRCLDRLNDADLIQTTNGTRNTPATHYLAFLVSTGGDILTEVSTGGDILTPVRGDISPPVRGDILTPVRGDISYSFHRSGGEIERNPPNSQPPIKDCPSFRPIQKEPSQWKTPAPPAPEPPPELEGRNLSFEVVEFAEICTGEQIHGWLREAYANLPNEVELPPGFVAEFVAKTCAKLLKRGRGKLDPRFNARVLFQFVREDLADTFNLELPSLQSIRPPRRPPARADSPQYWQSSQQNSYAAAAYGGGA